MLFKQMRTIKLYLPKAKELSLAAMLLLLNAMNKRNLYDMKVSQTCIYKSVNAGLTWCGLLVVVTMATFFTSP